MPAASRRRRSGGSGGEAVGGSAGSAVAACRRGGRGLRRMQLATRRLQPVEHLGEERRRLRLASRRHFRLFVFVLGIANDATRSSDFVVDHRHDGMVGNAALAWTVIVQHVTRPEPAVLHATPQKISE